jgi:hypothetical protein
MKCLSGRLIVCFFSVFLPGCENVTRGKKINACANLTAAAADDLNDVHDDCLLRCCTM